MDRDGRTTLGELDTVHGTLAVVGLPGDTVSALIDGDDHRTSMTLKDGQYAVLPSAQAVDHITGLVREEEILNRRMYVHVV